MWQPVVDATRFPCLLLTRLGLGRPGEHVRGQAKKLQLGLKPLRTDLHTLMAKPMSAAGAVSQGTSGVSTTGLWKKDKALSSPMDEACELVQLPWLLKKALLVLNSLEVEEAQDHFRTQIKAGGLMDVVERYPWTGEDKQHPRRDKRKGHHTGHVERTPEGPTIKVRWDDPYGGECVDTFLLSEDGDMLTQRTEMIMKTGKSCTYSTVHRRAKPAADGARLL